MSSTGNWEGHAEPVLVLPSAQITCVLASTGLKSPACAVVRLLARRAVISKPYAFFVESVIWTWICMVCPGTYVPVFPLGRIILTLPLAVFGVPVWQPDEEQAVLLSPGAAV